MICEKEITHLVVAVVGFPNPEFSVKNISPETPLHTTTIFGTLFPGNLLNQNQQQTIN
ncbi:hypothetical protein [Calothrix sp. UHCC 0171]|uniref:hypothetical protein n=1 Tax=Calothrix sp. UHCC 0171 TaxID=3110245 RepID=UPI002B211690|nr:hypothetical protein [Calothrix sp. UHCC 0171]MEA5572082.1 hypothetical protein [Calothrix sp. UHCC 0171]